MPFTEKPEALCFFLEAWRNLPGIRTWFRQGPSGSLLGDTSVSADFSRALNDQVTSPSHRSRPLPQRSFFLSSVPLSCRPVRGLPLMSRQSSMRPRSLMI